MQCCLLITAEVLIVFQVLLQTAISAEVDPTVRRCDDPNDIYLPSTATDTSQRLSDLRNEMNLYQYDAYVVPSEDEHLSEYISARDKKRVWITGFTGSAGTAVVTTDKAAVWTDGRYFLQAEQQLDCNWILMRTGEPGVPSIEEWISNELGPGGVAAANPFVFSIDSWIYQTDFLSKSQILFNQSFPDLIDKIWEDRPPSNGDIIFIYPVEYAGRSFQDKITDMRKEMTGVNADYLFLTRLEEIAWLFNLRGNELSGIPVFTSYALIGHESVKLYTNLDLLNALDLQSYLSATNCQGTFTCVETAEVDIPRDDLLKLEGMVWMSSESTTYGMYSAVDEKRQVQNISPVKMAKSVKNPVEIEGMKKAHIYDAVALCEYIMWLEKTVPDGTVDEMSGAAKLKSLRLAQNKSKGLSFGSISAVGANAAVIHYGATNETNKKLTTREIYLVDSGGQYFEGTTDVTRTMHFGEPTAFEKEAFTRVLMAMTDIELAIFPETLDGNDIDIVGRQHLYDVGLDFRHGTGHGIDPPAIGRAQAEGYPLQPGMFTSNEPGYYEDGKFGIRLENIVMVEEAETKLDHINAYHSRVMEKIGEELSIQGKSDVHDWLSQATKPINSASRSFNTILPVLLGFLSLVVMKL